MNFVHIIGRLGKDPETRFTADGKKVTVLVVATNSRKGGQEETIWWRVSMWGDRWDKMVSHLSKGKPIMVGGEMKKPELYTDKNRQQQLGSIEINGDYLKFMPFGKSDQQDQGSGEQLGEQQFQRAEQYSHRVMQNQMPHDQEILSGNVQQGFSQLDVEEEESLPF